MDLPKPKSDDLAKLVTEAETRAVYEFLYDRRDNPPTMVEVEEHIAGLYGEKHAQTGRRLRNLRDVYRLRVPARYVKGRGYVYFLEGFADESKNSAKGRRPINRRVRAEVLLRDGSRCAMCGRTPQDDHIKLDIDHKVPLDWADLDDPNDPANLQPLCTDCNAGKKAHYAAFDEYADAIRAARKGADPWTRIGELFKAMLNKQVPRELITIVAGETHAGDDLKRARELRYIFGWDIQNSPDRSGSRTKSFYRCLSWKPFPPEGPEEIVRRHEQERKAKKRARDAKR
ncbi:MAG TPA: HNH endonuclease signature motif containing protein [Terriglobales bacterium]